MSRRIAVVGALAALAFVGLIALGEPARTYRHNDFASFWVMGRMLLDGGDQYDFTTYLAAHQAIGSRALTIVLPDTASFYPLTTAFVFVPFALMPLSVAAPLWLVSQIVVAGAALVALARRLVPAEFARRDAFVLVGLAAGSQPAWTLAQGGNMGGLTLALAASAVTLLLADRPVGAGALAGALLVIKPHPLLIAMALIAIAVPRRDALRMLASASAVAFVTLAVSVALRPGWIGEFVSQLARVSAYGTRVRQSTLFGLLGADLVWLAWLLLAAVIVATLVWLRARPPLPTVIGAAVCVSLFVVPYGFSYDHLLLAIPVAVALGFVARAEPRRRTPELLVLALAFVLLPWVLYRIAYIRFDESLNALSPLAVLAALAVAARLGRPVSL